MPIPVGRSGNVDGPRRTTNCAVCGAEVVGSWWDHNILCGRCMREWVVPTGEQRRSVPRSVSARSFGLAGSSASLRSASVAPESSLDELEDTDNGDRTDGS